MTSGYRKFINGHLKYHQRGHAENVWQIHNLGCGKEIVVGKARKSQWKKGRCTHKLIYVPILSTNWFPTIRNWRLVIRFLWTLYFQLIFSSINFDFQSSRKVRCRKVRRRVKCPRNNRPIRNDDEANLIHSSSDYMNQHVLSGQQMIPRNTLHEMIVDNKLTINVLTNHLTYVLLHFVFWQHY
jgi:hypothetical protein